MDLQMRAPDTDEGGGIVKRPLLRYHGGKFAIAKWIINQFPPHRIYVEPFCGAASVLLNKPKSPVEVLNDKYERLISAFKILRDPEQSKKLQELLRFTPYSIVEYYNAREEHPDPIEDARRLIILGHQSHGSTGASGGKKSGWRRGLRPKGQPSSVEWGNLWPVVTQWSDRLRSVNIECTDAVSVIKQWDAHDALHYVDPPYVISTRTNGPNGYVHEMTDDDHIKLANTLKSVQGSVVLSGYPSELYDHLYSDWHTIKHSTTADKAVPRTEVLWMNFEPYQEKQMELFA